MGKRKQEEGASPVNRLASLEAQQVISQLVRTRLTNLKRKRQWTLEDLVQALTEIGRAVGIELEGA